MYTDVTNYGGIGAEIGSVTATLFIIIMITVIIIAVVVAVTMIKRLVNLHTDYTLTALHNMPATLFNNHPYIISSGTPVGTKFTATYVGMVIE